MSQSILDTFLPYQRRFFLAPKRRKFWLSGRQLGKSHCIAGILAYKALERDGNLSLAISVNQRSASELLKKVASYAEAVSALTDGKVAHTSTFDSVSFSNGSRILSLPSSSSSMRGWTASCVCIDEAFFVPRLEDTMAAIAPTLTRDPNAELILASSAAGMNSTAYAIWEKALRSNEWYTQTTTIEDAVSDGLKVDVDSLRSMVPDEETFQTEYMCVFSKSMDAVFDPSLMETFDSLPSAAQGNWIGIDVGRTHDKTAFVMGAAVGDTLYVTDAETMEKADYQTQLDRIAELERRRRFNGGLVDAGGIGSMLAEYANSKVSRRISPFTFTSSSKTPLFESLRDLVFRRKILFSKPLLERMREDLSGVSRITTSEGKVAYRAVSDSSGHSDLSSALVLMIEAWKRNPLSSSVPVSFSPHVSRLSPWSRRI